jgi:hypothetical protein
MLAARPPTGRRCAPPPPLTRAALAPPQRRRGLFVHMSRRIYFGCMCYSIRHTPQRCCMHSRRRWCCERSPRTERRCSDTLPALARFVKESWVGCYCSVVQRGVAPRVCTRALARAHASGRILTRALSRCCSAQPRCRAAAPRAPAPRSRACRSAPRQHAGSRRPRAGLTATRTAGAHSQTGVPRCAAAALDAAAARPP